MSHQASAWTHPGAPVPVSVPPGRPQEEEDGPGPRLHARLLKHHGGVLRVRAMPQQPTLVATWSDSGTVQVWDVAPQVQEIVAEPKENAGKGQKPTAGAPGGGKGAAARPC